MSSIITSTHFDFAPPRDGDLELVSPAREHVALFVEQSRHELTRIHFPEYHNFTVEELERYVDKQPLGRGWSKTDHHPMYWFWMKVHEGPRAVGIAGDINLRVTDSPDAELALGHLAYHVLPQFRGRHLAARSVRMLIPLAGKHGMEGFWITCHPDNVASRKTCEIAGASFVDIRPVDKSDPRTADFGYDVVCRYYLPFDRA